MDKIIALEQQWLTSTLGECVGKAVTEIQLSRMTASLAEISIGLSGSLCLDFGYGLDRNLRFLHQLIETAAGDWIPASIDHNGCLEEICNGHPSNGMSFDRKRAALCPGLIPQNRNERRCIDDYRGSPRSS